MRERGKERNEGKKGMRGRREEGKREKGKDKRIEV